jgi:hypothetical protein
VLVVQYGLILRRGTLILYQLVLYMLEPELLIVTVPPAEVALLAALLDTVVALVVVVVLVALDIGVVAVLVATVAQAVLAQYILQLLAQQAQEVEVEAAAGSHGMVPIIMAMVAVE